MKIKFLFSLLFISPLLSMSQNINYLNQSPPGLKAELFNNGKLAEHPKGQIRSFNVSFSPDGKELFFSYYKATEANPEPIYEIKTYKLLNNKWTGPETAAFSGIHSDVDINFSPDGNYIFFSSDRPQPNSIGLDIYYCIKTKDGWSDPVYAGTNINTSEGEVYPSVSKKKNIFFRSNRQGGYGDDDLYRAEWVNGNFINVKNLGANINTKYSESNSVIAPDESYILFCTSRPETNNLQHIFISFQIGDNLWTKAVSIGDEVNTDAGAGAPTLSPDGKYLFFKKTRKPQRGIYWISTEIFNSLKPKH